MVRVPAMVDRWARMWFATMAVAGGAALVTEFVLSASFAGYRQFTTPFARSTNELFFFTILSNLLVLVTSAALAVRADRPGQTFRVLRLSALTGIVITAVVYHVVLAPIVHPHGLWIYTNLVL